MNVLAPTPTSRPGLWLPAALLLLFALSACSEPAGTDENGLEKTDTVSAQLAVDRGEVGVVVDVRDIFKKGYVATTVAIAFPDHAKFDATLDVDAVTSLAILRIHNDSLTAAEKAAFSNGVAVHFIVYDAEAGELAVHDETDLVLGDSGVPLRIATAQPLIPRPLALREGVPYLLQPENEDGVLHSDGTCSLGLCWTVGNYVPGDRTQQFRLTAIQGAPEDNTYAVGATTRTSTGVENAPWWWIDDRGFEPTHLDVVFTAEFRDAFVFEQDADGWVRIRIAGTQEYLVRVQIQSDGLPPSSTLAPSSTAASRFRLITDNIDWTVTDRGTVYHQPISPPAVLDFAYAATIKNCSPATVTETIGRTDSRIQTSSFSTKESLQLFAGVEVSVGSTFGFEYVPPNATGGPSGSAGGSLDLAVTRSVTATRSNDTTVVTSKTTEVSRTRSIEVPPFTAIEAFDAVRTIKDFLIPFTQVYRFSGTYREDGSPLSGAEIMTYMRLNLVEAVPTRIGAQHVDMGVRGEATVDQLFEAETQVNELPGACN